MSLCAYVRACGQVHFALNHLDRNSICESRKFVVVVVFNFINSICSIRIDNIGSDLRIVTIQQYHRPTKCKIAMLYRCERRRLPLLFVLLSLYCALSAVQCDAGSPFKNRADRSSGPLMTNTANPATLLNPYLGSHGHVRSPQQQQPSQYGYNDNYAEQYPAQIATVSSNYLPTPNPYQNQQEKLFNPEYAPAPEAPQPAAQPAAVPQVTQRQSFRNPFDVVYEWRQLEFAYGSFLERQRAILSGEFIPTNNVPLGIDRYRSRLFVTVPRWKSGVPASLATLPLPGKMINLNQMT